MKHGEQPQISAKWWKSSQPDGLKSADQLEDAFAEYESARHALDTRVSDSAVRAAQAALKAIEQATKKVIDEAKRGKDPEMKLTAQVLAKLDLDDAHDWVAAKAKQGDDDADDDSPLGAEQYPVYLRRLLRRLRTTPMNFAVVLGRKPEEHRMMLHRVTAPMVLAHRMVQETGMHLMTFGQARPDDGRAGTIQLTVEGRQLPGLKKKLRRMLRAHRPLAYQEISLTIGGGEVEDVDDPDDHELDIDFDEDPDSKHEAELRSELDSIKHRLTEAMAGSPQTRLAVLSGVERFVSGMKAGNLSAARSALSDLHTLIPGQSMSPPSGSPPTED